MIKSNVEILSETKVKQVYYKKFYKLPEKTQNSMFQQSLNDLISFDEVKLAISKLNTNKAVWCFLTLSYICVSFFLPFSFYSNTYNFSKILFSLVNFVHYSVFS